MLYNRLDLKFEGNDEKSKLDFLQKHQVSFEEAKEVFFDPLHISKFDHRFDYFEERWITLGTTTKDKRECSKFCVSLI